MYSQMKKTKGYSSFSNFILLLLLLLSLLLFERERQREREHEWGEGQRERNRESQADSMLSTEPDTGLEPTILRS